MTDADLLDLFARALADAAQETRDLGPLPDHHWDDRARQLVARMRPQLTAAQSVPLFISPGSTMTRPDVPHRAIPQTWGA